MKTTLDVFKELASTAKSIQDDIDVILEPKEASEENSTSEFSFYQDDDGIIWLDVICMKDDIEYGARTPLSKLSMKRMVTTLQYVIEHDHLPK